MDLLIISGLGALFVAGLITWLLPFLPFLPWLVVSWVVIYLWIRSALE